MSEFFAWLSSNSIAATTVVVSFSSLVVLAILIYLAAFLQGREVSFWPPRIGAKLDKSSENKATTARQAQENTKGRSGVIEYEANRAHRAPYDTQELVDQLSALRRENSDLRAILAFQEKISNRPTRGLPQVVSDEISKVFALRDRTIAKQDRKAFLETQNNGQEIAGGSSSGYVSCTKMVSSVLIVVAESSIQTETGSTACYVALVREDYEKSFKYSHSAYLAYRLIATKAGLRIAELESLAV